MNDQELRGKEEKDMRNGKKQARASQRTAEPRTEVSKREGFDLTVPMTPLERKALQITLGVLRTNTDYADFLNCWLLDYGRQLLSSHPPPPLLPEMSVDEEPVVKDVSDYVN